MAVEISEDLAASIRFARSQRDYWTKEYNNAVAQAEALADGEEELTVNGVVAFTNNRTKSFRTADFKKKNPAIYDFYTETQRVDVEVFNLERLKLGRPDLFAEYQSRSFRVVE